MSDKEKVSPWTVLLAALPISAILLSCSIVACKEKHPSYPALCIAVGFR